ncbi:hypothetical protein DVH24_013985 [Malus domestica]|uniref:Myb-like domain-containing protein n=1 Tax=Malus domestica TaxID=3750 RepID=A0A498JC86_MALDO|nr:hypothetical protein DVH24_013985 [Malus domestica]
MASSAIKGRAWTQKEDEVLCRAYRWVLEDSVRGSSQTSEGVWTFVLKKYLEWKKHLHPSLNKWHQALLAAACIHESGANYYDEVSTPSKRIVYEGQLETLLMLFEDPPQHRVGPTPVFGTASSSANMDEDGSPTI